MRCLFFALFGVLLWGCTEANPSYLPPDAGRRADAPIVVDLSVDRTSPSDSPGHDLRALDVLGPDLPQSECSLPEQCDDQLSCTRDDCQNGHCVHQLQLGCLIAGACVEEGAVDPTDACGECVSSSRADAYVSVDGRPCADGAICVAGACRAFETMANVSSVASPEGALLSVAHIPAAGGSWAVGRLGDGGVMMPLPRSATQPPVLVDESLVAIHHRMVAGEEGGLWVYGQQSGLWLPQFTLATQVGGPRRAIWGAVLGTEEVFYLAGLADGDVAGMQRCSPRGSLSWNCRAQSGFLAGAELGVVIGATQGDQVVGLWSAATSGYEHIYYNDGSGLTWSRAAPEGCPDQAGSVCSTSYATDYTAISGVGREDIWLVGLGGRVLQYDGQAWKRHEAVFEYQENYDLDAVYSAPDAKLVIIAGHRDLSWGSRYVSLYTHNREHQRWYGPINFEPRFDSPRQEAQILAMGGENLSDLWLVGQLPDAQGKVYPWVARLK